MPRWPSRRRTRSTPLFLTGTRPPSPLNLRRIQGQRRPHQRQRRRPGFHRSGRRKTTHRPPPPHSPPCPTKLRASTRRSASWWPRHRPARCRRIRRQRSRRRRSHAHRRHRPSIPPCLARPDLTPYRRSNAKPPLGHAAQPSRPLTHRSHTAARWPVQPLCQRRRSPSQPPHRLRPLRRRHAARRRQSCRPATPPGARPPTRRNLRPGPQRVSCHRSRSRSAASKCGP